MSGRKFYSVMIQRLNFIQIDESMSNNPVDKLIIQDTPQKLLSLVHRVSWYGITSKEMVRENW